MHILNKFVFVFFFLRSSLFVQSSWHADTQKHAPTQIAALQLVQVCRCDSMASINRPFSHSLLTCDIRFCLFSQFFFLRRTPAFSYFLHSRLVIVSEYGRKIHRNGFPPSYFFGILLTFRILYILASNEMEIDISSCLAAFLWPKSTFSFCHLSS